MFENLEQDYRRYIKGKGNILLYLYKTISRDGVLPHGVWV